MQYHNDCVWIRDTYPLLVLLTSSLLSVVKLEEKLKIYNCSVVIPVSNAIFVLSLFYISFFILFVSYQRKTKEMLGIILR